MRKYIIKLKVIILSFAILLSCGIDALFAQGCIGEEGSVTWSIWNDLPSRNFETLYSLENFPDHPDVTKKLGSLNTPNNYANYFASMMRGYIKVPTSGTVTFNVTGDDQTRFYISTDETKENLSLTCEVLTYSGDDEHDKDSSQTSTEISMTAGNYYYFELYNLEGSGGDHAQVYWQRSWVAGSAWVIVDFSHLFDFGCGSTCPERGTSCDDGNAQSINDQEDGFCNCVGELSKPNSCIGDRMKLDAYYYDSIPGSNLNALFESPNWPLLPSRRELLTGAFGPLELYTRDEYGSYVQGYLVAPVTGSYDFNVTGDNHTQFFLSSDDTESNKEANSVYITGSTDVSEHDKYELQTLSNIQLNAGQYYYFEFRHKENSWRDHFHVYWKTPFNQTSYWKKVPLFYLYDYGCDMPCVPQGTPCDDGDPFTDNDMFNTYCECVGDPCMPGDCEEPGGNFNAAAECAATDNLDIRPETSWMSCASVANPNTSRGSGHWILYDFGKTYKFKNSKIWNYNAPGLTNRGFSQVAVDYSIDGNTWAALGDYNWPAAPGTIDYAGITGPNFNELAVRYVLITGLMNHGATDCSGFSKVLFNATECGPVGTPCDDGDPFTMDDKMDANCNCAGQEISINDCEQDVLALGSTSLPEDNYSATSTVQSANTLAGGRVISFVAGESIVIMSGFTVGGGAMLVADIEDCIQNIVSDEMLRALKARKAKRENKKERPSILSLRDENTSNENLTKAYKEVIYRLEEPSSVRMELISKDGKVITTIVDRYHENYGTYRKYIPNSLLEGNSYSIRVKLEDETAILPISRSTE
ncbi:MAG: hypothetical protein ACJA01_003682 [Saprospiraceae bacterium]|jgi:hypothetical protein